MSSYEIAQLTGSPHNKVFTDTSEMLLQLGENLSKYLQVTAGLLVYMLDEELTLTLVTGYSVVARRNVVARWKALETGSFNPQDTQALLETIRLALQALESSERFRVMALQDAKDARALFEAVRDELGVKFNAPSSKALEEAYRYTAPAFNNAIARQAAEISTQRLALGKAVEVLSPPTRQALSRPPSPKLAYAPDEEFPF